MGLMMSVAMGLKHFRERFAQSNSDNLHEASQYIDEAWKAFLAGDSEKIMFRYMFTVQALSRELEQLRREAAAEVAPESPRAKPAGGS